MKNPFSRTKIVLPTGEVVDKHYLRLVEQGKLLAHIGQGGVVINFTKRHKDE